MSGRRGPIFDTELRKQPGDVDADGPWTDMEHAGNFTIGVSVHEQAQHIELARCQPGRRPISKANGWETIVPACNGEGIV